MRGHTGRGVTGMTGPTRGIHPEALHETKGLTTGPWARYALELRSGPLKRTLFVLEGRTAIGRAKENDLYLPHPGVSRHHARIFERGSELLLEDLGSKNGTYLNGTRIREPKAVKPQDRIRIGSVKLRVVQLGSPEDTVSLTETSCLRCSAFPANESFADRKLAIEDKLEFLQTFMEALSLGAILVTPNLEVVYFNRPLDPFGEDSQALLSSPLCQFLGCRLPGSTSPGFGLKSHCPHCLVCSAVIKSFEQGIPVHEVEVSWPPGGLAIRDLKFAATPLPYTLYGHRVCLLTWEDITRRKTAERRLDEANRDLEDANRQLASALEKANLLAFQAEAANIAKSAFLARMSHEIRTPLNAVTGYAEMLLESDLSAEQKEYATLVHRSGQTLLALIEDILDFSKIEAGQMRLENVPMNLMETVSEACEIISPRLKGKPVELVLEVEPNVPRMILGDPGRIRQVLLNLLGNAAKFTYKGKIELRVRLQGLQEGKAKILFAVKDTGIGIPGHKLHLIFEPFYQADDSTSRTHGGTGLGLTICRELARLMQGKLWAESKEGQGSIFYFEAPFGFPLENDQNSTDKTFHEENKAKDDMDASGGALTPVERVRILLVEDNPVNSNLARLILTKAGHSVEVAANGWEALKVFTEKPAQFHLILMDVEMPGMDGIEVTRRIRSLGHVEIPIVAMTAHALKEDKDRCLASGMNDYLSKPVRKDALLEMVSKWAPRRSTEDVGLG